jgi:hypothetical protein
MRNKAEKNKVKKISRRENQFGVVLEDINSKMQLVLEVVEANGCGIKKVREDLMEEIGKTNYKLDAFILEMAGFKKDTESSFSSLMEYMERLEKEISDFKKDLSEIDENKVDVKRFEKLEKEFYKLKSLVMESKRVRA